MQVKEHYHHGTLKKTLLAEALHELETEGLEGVSLRKVAESVGVSKSAPYRHFADKRELLVAIAADGFRLLAETLESGAPGGRQRHPGRDAFPLSRIHGVRSSAAGVVQAHDLAAGVRAAFRGLQAQQREGAGVPHPSSARSTGKGLAPRHGPHGSCSFPLGQRARVGHAAHRRPPASRHPAPGDDWLTVLL